MVIYPVGCRCSSKSKVWCLVSEEKEIRIKCDLKKKKKTAIFPNYLVMNSVYLLACEVTNLFMQKRWDLSCGCPGCWADALTTRPRPYDLLLHGLVNLGLTGKIKVLTEPLIFRIIKVKFWTYQLNSEPNKSFSA